MIICEKEVGFNYPDRDRPEYAHAEVDVFALNPVARSKGEDGDYRLSMRRSLSLGRWELYRAYYGGSEVVEAVGTLEWVCVAANVAWNEAWGHLVQKGETRHEDHACDHTPGSERCASRCPTAYPRR